MVFSVCAVATDNDKTAFNRNRLVLNCSKEQFCIKQVTQKNTMNF